MSAVLLDPSPETAYAFGLTQSGRFAIADFAKATLALYAPDGKRERVIAGPGRGYGELIRPLALATSGDELLVYDIGKAHLLRYDKDGNCVADQFQTKSSVSCPFAVRGSRQYRVGGLVLPDKRLCPAYSLNLEGTGQFQPLVCYDSTEAYDLFWFHSGCGYVDLAGDEIYIAIATELQVRVLDLNGRPLRNVAVGGPRARHPKPNGMTVEKAAIASEVWAWYSKFTFVDGLALLGDRIAVLVQDAEPDLGWRLEMYDRHGEFRSTVRVAEGATKKSRSVRLTGDHRNSAYVLVRHAEEGGASRYRVEKYEFPDN